MVSGAQWQWKGKYILEEEKARVRAAGQGSEEEKVQRLAWLVVSSQWYDIFKIDLMEIKFPLPHCLL